MIILSKPVEHITFFINSRRKFKASFKIEAASYTKVIEALTKPDGRSRNIPLMTTVKGSDIFVGDLLKLRRNEIAPCDLLVLASSDSINNNYICRMDSMYDDGHSLTQIKEALNVTKSFNCYTEDDSMAKQFLKRLNARVRYSRDIKTQSITGTFKLKSDPRLESINEHTVVKRSSILKSQFIYGLVLYNGRDCLDTQTTSSIWKTKRSTVQKKLDTFTLYTVISALIFSLVSQFCHDIFNHNDSYQLEKTLHDKEFFTYLTLFMASQPITLPFLVTIFHIVSTFWLQAIFRTLPAKLLESNNVRKSIKRLSEVENGPSVFFSGKTLDLEKKNAFRILNPSVVFDMGDTDDIFFDKTGTLTDKNYEIITLATKSKFYDVSDGEGEFKPNSMYKLPSVSISWKSSFVSGKEPSFHERPAIQVMVPEKGIELDFMEDELPSGEEPHSPSPPPIPIVEESSEEEENSISDALSDNEVEVEITDTSENLDIPEFDFATARMGHDESEDLPADSTFEEKKVIAKRSQSIRRGKNQEVSRTGIVVMKPDSRETRKLSTGKLSRASISKSLESKHVIEKSRFGRHLLETTCDQNDFCEDAMTNQEILDILVMYACCHASRRKVG